MLNRTCRNEWCRQPFTISDEDISFYDKVSPVFVEKKELIPPPNLCPDCRQQRRSAFRNERNLYHRTCDLTGKPIISMYSPASKHTVYDKTEWWSDKWDPLSYGREIDFNRPFFDQYKDLQLQVPRPSLHQKNVENSDFTNHVENLKNGYLCFDVGANSEDVYYSKWIINGKDVCDCYMCEKDERCFEILYALNDFQCRFLYYSDDCSNCEFIYDCFNCDSCFMSCNLRHKKFVFRNEQLSEQEYKQRMSTIDFGSHNIVQPLREEFLKMLREKAVHRASALFFAEDCSGDMIYSSKNVKDSYDINYGQDSRFCYETSFLKDCYDVYESAFDCELQYDSYSCNRAKFIFSTGICYDCYNLLYCNNCHNSHDLFGCIGMKRNQHCILNKQYTKDEYEQLSRKLIEHMRATEEWGEHFPISLSTFGYNESVAQDQWPIERQTALSAGWHWNDYVPPEAPANGIIDAAELPDSISDVDDDILNWTIRCEKTGKPFRIIKQELEFYRIIHVPLPRLHPNARHAARLALLNPRKLWERNCMSCGNSIQSTFSPDRLEKVYCQSCFQKAVY